MLRVTQRTMYSTMTNQMNNNLSAYMESNMQGSTMKKINKPSDDPAGMARILAYRSSIDRISQLEQSSDTALGWLQLADATLSNSVSTLLGSSILPLAEEAAGVVTAENRLQIAQQLREYLGTLVNLSNTKYDGKHIFAGQNYNGSAFVEGLTVDTANLDGQGPNPSMQVSGTLKTSTLVRFPIPDPAPNPLPASVQVPPAAGDPPLAYEWSSDGGKTWTKGSIADTDTSFQVGGANVKIPPKSDGTANTFMVKYADPAGELSTSNGSVLTIRPTAIYQGSDNNATPKVEQFGTVKIPPTITTTTTGDFSQNTLIQFPNGADLSVPGSTFEYKYSTDGGLTWSSGQAEVKNNSAQLLLPGGSMDLGLTAPLPPAADCKIPAGGQLSLKPQRTDLNFTIMEGQTITVNNVGKEIFGGLYRPQYGNNLEPAFGENDGRNLFETLGRLIGYCETNNTDGIGKCIEDLKLSQKTVLSHATAIGGKENRLEVTLQNLDDNKFDQQTRMSNLEDVDLTSLMVRLTQQQMAYQTILKSSSMIMQLNLTQFV